MINFKDINITVVGLGVIGGSFAAALKEMSPCNIAGVDINQKTIEYAISSGIIDNGYTTSETPLKDSDLVIICLYPKLVVDFIKDNKDNFKKGCIIIDTTGVKCSIIDDIENIINDDVDFVFGHPMAGRESKGILFASKSVFKGSNYLITPTPKNKEENIKFIEELVLKIGFKRVRRISPKRHDEIISYTSQLPHVIAVSLINSESFCSDTGDYIGDSFRELTRIAKINEDLWVELFMENRGNLIREIELFEGNISKIKQALLNEDNKELVEYLTKAKLRREKIDS